MFVSARPAIVRTGDINAGTGLVWPTLDTAAQRLVDLHIPITESAWDIATCDFWVRAGAGSGWKGRAAGWKGRAAGWKGRAAGWKGRAAGWKGIGRERGVAFNIPS